MGTLGVTLQKKCSDYHLAPIEQWSEYCPAAEYLGRGNSVHSLETVWQTSFLLFVHFELIMLTVTYIFRSVFPYGYY